MNGAVLKSINNKVPLPIKKAFAPLIRNRLVKNKIFQRTYYDIDAFGKLSCQQKADIQLKKLKDILAYAYMNTAYYKRLFDEYSFNPYTVNDFADLIKLPMLSREKVTENFKDLLSKENMSYYFSETGGSTGTPFRFALETDSLYREKAFIYHFWSRLGYEPIHSRNFTIRGTSDWGSKKFKLNPINNEIIVPPILLGNDTIRDYVDLYCNFGAEYIHGYPSAVKHFCQLLQENKLLNRLKVKGVFLISETVYEADRSYIEQTLQTKTLTFYGHTERCSFAEFIDNSYIFNPLYGHTELVKRDGEDAYSIVSTGFLSRKLPLIRYLTDDTAYMSGGRLNIESHKQMERVICKENRILTILTLNAYNTLLHQYKVKEFQFIQNEPGKVILNVIPYPGISYDLVDMSKKINDQLNNILDVEIAFVNNVILTNRGKCRKIIQNLKIDEYQDRH